MRWTHSRTNFSLAVALAGMLAIGSAMADKPSWAGGGKQSSDRDARQSSAGGDNSHRNEYTKGERHDAYDRSSRDDGRNRHFEDRHRASVRDYYAEHYRGGRCPPGLAKKHNGCIPPGHARKWHIGQPLARDVIYYSVPQTLVLELGQPPYGYRYVRVASDILLMAIGTGLIIDAIQDLGA
jgi:Ni/Co efflux regulator RcnB